MITKTQNPYPLLFYFYAIDRLWRRLLIFDAVLWLAWWFAPYSPYLAPPNDQVLFFAGIAIAVFAILFYTLPKRAVVRVEKDQLLVSVPFYTFKIPYAYVKSMQITELKHALKGVEMKKSEIKFLQRFDLKTPVAVLLLKEIPKPVWLLPFFFPSYWFLAEGRGMIFMVENLMAFNNEFNESLTSARFEREMQLQN